MSTDQALRPLLAQFVQLTMEVNQPDWQNWARQFPVESRGIPLVYIVTSEGEKIYAASGAPGGDSLGLLLQQSLAKAGTILTDEQTKRLSDAVAGAREALEKDDVPRAIGVLASAPGRGSKAELALEAEKLVKQITDQANSEIAEVKKLLDGSDTTLQGALKLMEASRKYRKLPDHSRRLESMLRHYQKAPASADVLAQAEELDQAMSWEKSGREERSIHRYQEIVEKYAGTDAAAMATTRLKTLQESGVKTVALASTTPGQEPRTWTDRSGKFSVTATLLAFEGGNVRLQTEDGRTITVPAAKLSPADGRHILAFINRSGGSK